MKSKIVIKYLFLKSSILLLLLGILGFTSCNKEDDIQPEYGVPVSLIDNFDDYED